MASRVERSGKSWVWWWFGMLLGACFGGEFVQGLPCESDDECGPGFSCVDGYCGGLGSGALCGNGLVEAGEECDDGNALDGDECTSACLLQACGDAILGPDEECDDGNMETDDSCTPECLLPVCGDGHLAPGEWCDDGNEAEGDGCPSDCLGAPVLRLSISKIKKLDLNWSAIPGADWYELYERVNTDEEWTQIEEETIAAPFVTLTMPLHLRTSASYRLRGCNETRCTSYSDPAEIVGSLAEAVGYFKASNTDTNDMFGRSVALSDDGDTLAVGAVAEASGSIRIGGDEDDNSVSGAGAAYIFVREDEGNWSQQEYLKASSVDMEDRFGVSVALSGDGSTLAVGASEQGPPSLTGVSHCPLDPLPRAGEVYVFVRDLEGNWSEQQRVEASNGDPGDGFGLSIALSRDGNTLAVGAPCEDSNASGVDDDNFEDSGAAYTFVREAGVWSPQAYIKASNTDPLDEFGAHVALSNNGDVLAVGADREGSNATGVNSDQTNNEASSAGAVYIYTRDEAMEWSHQAYIKASNSESPGPNAGDRFGMNMSLSGSGCTLAVGAPWEDSGATGVNTDQRSNASLNSGAVYLFECNGTGGWSQAAYIKASNTGDQDAFGHALTLSEDGDVLAVGAVLENGNGIGVNGGDQLDNTLDNAGAAYVFERDGAGGWRQRSYVKASNARMGGAFGASVSLSADGHVLAVGGFGDSSSATEINGDQANGDAPNSGAVYLY